MATIDRSTPRTTRSRVGGASLPAKPGLPSSTRRTPSHLSSSSAPGTTARHRKPSLDQGDGLQDDPVDADDKLKEALRRSMSAREDAPETSSQGARRAAPASSTTKPREGNQTVSGKDRARRTRLLYSLDSLEGPAEQSASPSGREARRIKSTVSGTVPSKASQELAAAPLMALSSGSSPRRVPIRKSSRDDLERLTSSSTDATPAQERRQASQQRRAELREKYGKDSKASLASRSSPPSEDSAESAKAAPLGQRNTTTSRARRSAESSFTSTDQDTGSSSMSCSSPLRSKSMQKPTSSSPGPQRGTFIHAYDSDSEGEDVAPLPPIRQGQSKSSSPDTINSMDVQSKRQRRPLIETSPNDKAPVASKQASSEKRAGKDKTSYALAALEASLAKLGAGPQIRPSDVQVRIVNTQQPIPRPAESNSPCLPRALRSPTGSDPVVPVPAPKTSLRRHQERLSGSEKGGDDAGNSPRKGLVSIDLVPASSKDASSTGTPARPAQSFLERARAVRAQSQLSAVERKAKEVAIKMVEDQQAEEAERLRSEAEQRRAARLEKASKRRSMPPTRISLSPESADALLSEDEEDELRIEREVTPTSSISTGRKRPTSEISPPDDPSNQISTEGPANTSESARRAAKLAKRRTLYVTPSRLGAEVDQLLHISEGVGPLGKQGDRLLRGPSLQPARNTALQRRASDRCRSSPPVAPIPSDRFLRGVVVLVDVRSLDGVDQSAPFVQLLKAAGARVASRIPSQESKRQLTHLVWKNGRPSTWRYWQGLEEGRRPVIVGAGWVDECLRLGSKVKEEGYLVELGREQALRRTFGSPSYKGPIRPWPSVLDTNTGRQDDLLEKSIEEAMQSALQHAPLEPSPLRNIFAIEASSMWEASP